VPWSHMGYLFLTMAVSGAFHEMGHATAAVAEQVWLSRLPCSPSRTLPPCFFPSLPALPRLLSPPTFPPNLQPFYQLETRWI